MGIIDNVLKRIGYTKKVNNNIFGTNDVLESYSEYLGYKEDKREMIAQYSSWVYACVSLIAKASSKSRFRLYKEKGADEYEEIYNHQILKLINSPNPFETKLEFVYRLITHLYLTGDAYIYLAKNKLNTLKEMYVLQPDRMNIVPHETSFIEKYTYSIDSGKENKTQDFSIDEILHLKLPSPSSSYYGASPLSACAMSVNIDEYQHKYQMKLYKNGAMPPLVLETEQGLDEMSVKRLRRDWDRLYKGDGNSGRTAILEKGLKAKKIGIDPKELDWLANNRATRDDILAIYGVPPALLGLVEDSNRSNGETQEYTFHRQVIEPLLCMIDEKLTKNFEKAFGDEKLIVRHDSTVPYDSERGARASQIRILSGQTTINEERLSQGFKAIDGGDEILVPLNYALLSNVKNGIMTDGKSIPQDTKENI